MRINDQINQLNSCRLLTTVSGMKKVTMLVFYLTSAMLAKSDRIGPSWTFIS